MVTETFLRNGNCRFDLSKVLRCGAKTRRGTACGCPAMSNGRCRLHGGASTGARTAAGLERIRLAATKHGCYSKAAIAERRAFNQLLNGIRSLCGTTRGA